MSQRPPGDLGKEGPRRREGRKQRQKVGTRLVESWSRESSSGRARVRGGQDPYCMAVSAVKEFRFKKFLVYCFVSAFFHNLGFIFSASTSSNFKS